MILPHKISALIYAFHENGGLLMIHRRQMPNAGYWSPFGGKLKEDAGESPHQCAVRETFEEIGQKFSPSDFHLTGLVAEKAYEGQTHWLMFMFGLKPRLRILPPEHPEGSFEFVPLHEIEKRRIPESDRQVLWPLFQKHRGSFFCISIDCLSDGKMNWNIEQV